jgi:HD-like signal output (HDOD) protein/CheY-like chemotaxis protein
MKRILFVDDEAKILDGLRRSLRNLRGQWEMVFADGGVAALRECASRPFDVVVSDARMPGMEGSEFLGKVRNLYPDSARIILSGQCSRNSVLRCVAVAHQFLSKPCEPGTLTSALQRLCEIRDSFHDGPARGAISCVRWLPSRATICQELSEQIESPTASIERVATIVARDVGMSAKVVQLVSSGFFGTPQRVSSPAQAVKLLGLETFKAMLASYSAFHTDSTSDQEESLRALAAHSLAVAEAAKQIAETLTDDRTLIGDAYLAGFLHLIGTLVVAGRNQGEPDPGGYLAALWGLPNPVVQAIAHYRTPRNCPDPPSVPLAAVHVANALRKGPDDAADEAVGFLDLGYLQSCGWAAHLDDWREKCLGCQLIGIPQ